MANYAKPCRKFIAGSLILLTAGAAYGEEMRPLRVTSQPVAQTVYKGVVGNLLEEVPIDPESRVDLQRGSAVISNVLSGRSLAIALGITNPVFLVAGLAWGLYAASQIKLPAPAVTITKLASFTAAKDEPLADTASSDVEPASLALADVAPADVEPVSLALAENPMFCSGQDDSTEATSAIAEATPADEVIASAR